MFELPDQELLTYILSLTSTVYKERLARLEARDL